MDLCEWKGVEIIEGHLMPDHVYLLLDIPSRISLSSFMGYLKGKSSLMIFEHHGNLKYKFGSKTFWATGYYVSTVGLNEAIIRKYIREQENEDMIKDKFAKKEFINHFKGMLSDSALVLNKEKASLNLRACKYISLIGLVDIMYFMRGCYSFSYNKLMFSEYSKIYTLR